MTTTLTQTSKVVTMDLSVRRAMDAIGTPEVQDIIKRLADFNLAVCVPHMHGEEVDFSALPHELVQLEGNCQVRWVETQVLGDFPQAIHVAWRWVDDGVHAAAECMAVCAMTDDGHKRTGHLPGE